MKRFFSILLVAIIMVSSLATVAAATEPRDTFVIDVTVTGEFSNFLVSISADEGLTIQSITGAGASVVNSATTGKANWAGASNVKEFTFQVTVKVDEDIEPGTYYVTASADRASKVISVEEDTNDGIVDGLTATTVTVTGGSITIAEPACEHSWDDGVVTKEPTCTETGVKTYTCTKCRETKTETIDMVAHKFGEWTEVKAASCTEEGLKTRTCSVCGHVEEQPITKVAHKLGDWEKDKDNHWHVCTVCGEIFDCAAHTYPGSWTVGKEATETEDGWKYKNCEVCGWQVTDKIPAGLDDVAETGDITGQVTMGAAAVLAMLAAAVAFVFKRKFAK